MVPRAGSSNGFGISTTTSGVMFQPVGKTRAGGAVAGSPAGAPPSAQRASVSSASGLNTFSLALAYSAWPGSANQGGIALLWVAFLIAAAHGRALMALHGGMVSIDS